MQNLTLEDFYNPTIISLSKICMDTAAVCQTIMLPVILYVVFKNHKMGMYRWYIMNEILSNVFLCLLAALFSPVCLGVHFIVLVNSSFEQLFDIETWYLISDFAIFSTVNM